MSYSHFVHVFCFTTSIAPIFPKINNVYAQKWVGCDEWQEINSVLSSPNVYYQSRICPSKQNQLTVKKKAGLDTLRYSTTNT